MCSDICFKIILPILTQTSNKDEFILYNIPNIFSDIYYKNTGFSAVSVD